MSTALAQKSNAPIVQVGNYSLAEVVNQQLWKDPTALEGKANILFPITALDNLPPFKRASLTVVKVKPEVAAREVYPVGDGKMGLSKPVIMKMLNAAGASVSTRKLSDRSDLDFIEWQATVSGYTPDGQFHQQTASKTWVWEKIKAERGGAQQRKFADEICETKAILRAARAFLNIQTSYTVPELQLPFLIASAVPDLDPTDPDVKKALIAQATGASQALYPQNALPPTPEADPEDVINADDEREQTQVIDGQFTEHGTAADSDEEYNPDADPAEAERAAMEAKVASMAKKTGDGGIGVHLGKVLSRYNTRTWVGLNLDTLHAIYEDCVAVKEGRLSL